MLRPRNPSTRTRSVRLSSLRAIRCAGYKPGCPFSSVMDRATVSPPRIISLKADPEFHDNLTEGVKLCETRIKPRPRCTSVIGCGSSVLNCRLLRPRSPSTRTRSVRLSSLMAIKSTGCRLSCPHSRSTRFTVWGEVSRSRPSAGSACEGVPRLSIVDRPFSIVDCCALVAQ